MIRLISAAALVISLSRGVEATPLPDLSNVKCSDAYTINFIKTALPTMRTAEGRSILEVLANNATLMATLIYARKDRFACRISVNMASGHGTQGIVGEFSYREFPGGKNLTKFTSGY
jgi:hypothetical protein